MKSNYELLIMQANSRRNNRIDSLNLGSFEDMVNLDQLLQTNDQRIDNKMVKCATMKHNNQDWKNNNKILPRGRNLHSILSYKNMKNETIRSFYDNKTEKSRHRVNSTEDEQENGGI